jgi:hypothetical protein
MTWRAQVAQVEQVIIEIGKSKHTAYLLSTFHACRVAVANCRKSLFHLCHLRTPIGTAFFAINFDMHLVPPVPPVPPHHPLV